MRKVKTKHLLSKEEKLAWGAGEWVEEPDAAEFKYKGFRCVCIRNFSGWGNLNGYIVLPNGHPWFGKDNTRALREIDVHGGITFSEGNGEEWTIGFDCAHSMDIAPAFVAINKKCEEDILKRFPSISKDSPIFERTYKNLNYVIKECKSLVDQAIKAANE